MSSTAAVWFGAQHFEELTDLVLDLFGMPHGPSGVHDVAVSPSDSLALHVARIDEIVDDSLSRPFRDSDNARNVAKPCLGIALNRQENLCMAREEVPAAVYFRT